MHRESGRHRISQWSGQTDVFDDARPGYPAAARGTAGELRRGHPSDESARPGGGFGVDFPDFCDLVTGKVLGRTNDTQITFCHNLGNQGLQLSSGRRARLPQGQGRKPRARNSDGVVPAGREGLGARVAVRTHSAV